MAAEITAILVETDLTSLVIILFQITVVMEVIQIIIILVKAGTGNDIPVPVRDRGQCDINA